MDREQMIDRAAEILWRTGMGLSLDGLEWSNTSNQDSYQRRARAVLDAILPQITTVEELEALPPGTKVLGANGSAWEFEPYGSPWQWFGTNGDEWASSDLVANYGPLTVVWRP